MLIRIFNKLVCELIKIPILTLGLSSIFAKLTMITKNLKHYFCCCVEDVYVFFSILLMTAGNEIVTVKKPVYKTNADSIIEYYCHVSTSVM